MRWEVSPPSIDATSDRMRSTGRSVRPTSAHTSAEIATRGERHDEEQRVAESRDHVAGVSSVFVAHVDAKVNNILNLAVKRKWSKAQLLANKEIQTSFDPTLVLAAAMIHFCAGDHRQAGRLFESALSMDNKNVQARLLLYLIDWMADRSHESPHRRDLLALDWRSPHEFFGYLVRVLEKNVATDPALRSGCTDDERNWLRYIVALAAAGNDAAEKAEKLLQPVILTTSRENWLHFLALSRLQQIWRQNLTAMDDPEAHRQYLAKFDQLDQKLQTSRRELAERQRILAPLLAQAAQESLAPEIKQALLEKILEIDDDNGNLLVELVFYCAMNAEWDRALDFARRYAALDCRENLGRLRVELLAAEILAKTERRPEAVTQLENYRVRTMDPWYRMIAECLLTPKAKNLLEQKAGENPEYLLTGHVALGFWAEGSGDKNTAIDHYREALGSYMDDMIEYNFAAERIKKLRQK